MSEHLPFKTVSNTLLLWVIYRTVHFKYKSVLRVYLELGITRISRLLLQQEVNLYLNLVIIYVASLHTLLYIITYEVILTNLLLSLKLNSFKLG